MSEVLRTYSVNATRAVCNDKGVIVSNVRIEGYPQDVNATSETNAIFLAQARLMHKEGIFSGETVDEVAVLEFLRGTRIDASRVEVA